MVNLKVYEEKQTRKAKEIKIQTKNKVIAIDDFLKEFSHNNL